MNRVILQNDIRKIVRVVTCSSFILECKPILGISHWTILLPIAFMMPIAIPAGYQPENSAKLYAVYY